MSESGIGGGGKGRFQVATDLGDALALLASAASSVVRPLAGATDIMVDPGCQSGDWVDVSSVAALRGISVDAGGLSVGAACTFSEIGQSDVVAGGWPLLRRAAMAVGAPGIRNMATIGGNVANASPAADSSPALLAYDAELELVSRRGARRVPYSEFHTAYKKTVLAPDELISRFFLPPTSRSGGDVDGRLVGYYRKVGARGAQAISKVSLAARAYLSVGTTAAGESVAVVDEVRLAVASVAPTPIRILSVEDALGGESWSVAAGLGGALVDRCCARLLGEIAPIDDGRSSAAYRRAVTTNLLQEFLEQVGDAVRHGA